MNIDAKDLIIGPGAVIIDDDVDLDKEPITLPSGRVIKSSLAWRTAQPEALASKTATATDRTDIVDFLLYVQVCKTEDRASGSNALADVDPYQVVLVRH